MSKRHGDNSRGDGKGINSSTDGETQKGADLSFSAGTKVVVEGAHRIWGTLKVNTTSSLQAVITKLVGATSLSFKRKTICGRSG